MMATLRPGASPVPSRNPIPLSASQEAAVTELYHKRVRNLCADEIRGASMAFQDRNASADLGTGRIRSMCVWPNFFSQLGMSAATSGNEWMYDDPCNAKGAGCGEGRVVRNYGREAQKTRGRRKEKAGSKTSTSGMVGARQRWPELRGLSWNIDCSGWIDFRHWAIGASFVASAYGVNRGTDLGIKILAWTGNGTSYNMDPIKHLFSSLLWFHTCPSPCSICLLVLLWTISTQSVASLGSILLLQPASSTANSLQLPRMGCALCLAFQI